MMIQSETLLPMFKWWSPMSVGSWALMVFGAFSFFSFLAALAEDDRLPISAFRALHHGTFGKVFVALGAAFAFFLASYTGVLLSVTNRPDLGRHQPARPAVPALRRLDGRRAA